MTLQGSEKQQAAEGLRKRSEFEDNLTIRAFEDESFRQQLIADPKAIYEQELGTKFPSLLKIETIEEQPNTIYLVLPRKHEAVEGEGELSDEALDAVAGGLWGYRPRSWVVAWSGIFK